MLRADPELTAASSWMQTFGVLDSEVRPAGGDVTAFLSRNCCPATHMFRRKIWEACGGYDESMRSGFEDWEFFPEYAGGGARLADRYRTGGTD